MTLIAGIDIGNSTTEIVIQEDGQPRAWRRRPTRGVKGSPGSVRAAAALLKSIEKDRGIRAERVIVAPWHPVTTATLCVSEPPPDTGRFRVLKCDGHSFAGDAAAVGTPWVIDSDPPGDGAVIAVVPHRVGYRQAVPRIVEAIARGVSVAGVVAARDEAVLIATRLGLDIPVLDGIDTLSACKCTRLFLEARPSGTCVKQASDAWALAANLDADSRDVDALALIARWVRDERAVVIGVTTRAGHERQRPVTASVTWSDGNCSNLFDAVERMAGRPVGAVSAYSVEHQVPTRDLWAIDITATVAARGLRSPGRSRDVVLASLAATADAPTANIDRIFDRAVEIASSEAAAADRGARTTPGLSGRALVLDIGGGTIDLVGEHDITAAGAGDLLSAAVARLLGVPRGAADWIKRGPARRVESPRVLLDEDGSRHFVSPGETALTARATGCLVTRGPGGVMSFGGAMQPAEWRIVRQSLKQAAIADNVGRVLASYLDRIDAADRHDVVVVGGPAGDDELMPALGRLDGIGAFGRGNVAGVLGHRYAVAYGLTLLATNA